MAFERLKRWLVTKVATWDYRPAARWSFRQPRDLPLFNWDTIDYMLIDPTIRLGLAMRAAPLHQAEFAYKVADSTNPQGFKWVPGIRADKPEVARFVMQQLNRIWQHELGKILTAQIYGWFAGEVTYSLSPQGLVEVDGVLHRYARDVFAMLEHGEVKAVRFTNLKHSQAPIRFPKAIWHAYEPENESPYGRSALKGALSPWSDKWLNGGGLDVRRLFMHKDAYGGMRMGYPAGTTNIDGKGEVPNRDIAREIVEQVKAGGVLTHPTDIDPATGKDRWQIEWAHVASNPAHILQYPKDLDKEILNGLEIPDDVLTSEGTGAWQGKQVPMMMFFTSADKWLHSVVKTLVMQVLEPLVLINWGRAEEFEVTTKPLAEQAMEQMKPDSGGSPSAAGEQDAGTPFGNNGNGNLNGNGGFQLPRLRGPLANTRRFALGDDVAEQLVGSGVLSANRLVSAARTVMRGNRRFRFEAAHDGNDGQNGKRQRERPRDAKGRFVKAEEKPPEDTVTEDLTQDVIAKLFNLTVNETAELTESVR